MNPRSPAQPPRPYWRKLCVSLAAGRRGGAEIQVHPATCHSTSSISRPTMVWPVSAVGILMQGIVADRTQWRDTSKSPIAGEALGPVGTVL